MMFSSPSFAKWTKVDENVKGDTFYVDFERIKKVDGYVYIWSVTDYLKPDKYGEYSEKSYRQVDCKLFRFKFLSSSFHKEPMGRGNATDVKISNLQKWIYPSPNSSGEGVLQSVCEHAK